MDGKGMFTELMEISDDKPEAPAVSQPESPAAAPQASARPSAKPVPVRKAKSQPPAIHEDIKTVAYLSQNYRFTESELRWIRQQSYDLTERLGFRVPQSTVLRIAINHLQDECDQSPGSNPLLNLAAKLKK